MHQKLARWLAVLTTSVFNQLSQYAYNPENRLHCYAELHISFLALIVSIASTHFTYPQRDNQIDWPGWPNGIPENENSSFAQKVMK